jgi:hypothetical protein
MPNSSQQLPLPYTDADASEAERWNDLVLALHRIGTACDAEMSAFIRWVYNTTKHDPAAELVRSYRKLAERPLGLCCSAEKARSTVETAERLGLVTVHRRRRFDGAQQDNGYQLHWQGIRALKQHAAASIANALADGLADHPPGLADHPPGLADHPPALADHHIRKILSCSSSDILRERGPAPAICNEEPKPQPQAVRQHFTAAGLRGDPAAFHAYYAARGWKRIIDWKAAAAAWSLREQQFRPASHALQPDTSALEHARKIATEFQQQGPSKPILGEQLRRRLQTT